MAWDRHYTFVLTVAFSPMRLVGHTGSWCDWVVAAAMSVDRLMMRKQCGANIPLQRYIKDLMCFRIASVSAFVVDSEKYVSIPCSRVSGSTIVCGASRTV